MRARVYFHKNMEMRILANCGLERQVHGTFFSTFTYIPRGAGLGSEYNPGPNSERDFSDIS